MRKRIITTFFVLFLLGKIFGQIYHPVLPSNTIWNVIISNNGLNPHPDWHFRYGFIGDTLIDGMNYTKIYELFNDTNLVLTNTTNPPLLGDTSKYQSLFGFVREENKEIYFRDTFNTEMLLYDFSKQIGDTLIMEDYMLIDGALQYFGESTKIITNIDSVLLGNGYHRRYTLNYIIYGSWIEGIGIGNTYGLLTPIMPICLCGDIYTLACVKQNDTIQILENPNCASCFCSIYTDIPEMRILNKYSIDINPNPIIENASVTIKPQLDNYSFEIVNCIGQVIYKKTDLSESNFTLERRNLTSGLYMARILSYGQIIDQRKILIK